ncbi:MAG: hypothetical protein HY274_10855 [Gammaproteobacteria bacterium]|nr:hypothetical protein [Gammaproteobacteria bacterium]
MRNPDTAKRNRGFVTLPDVAEKNRCPNDRIIVALLVVLRRILALFYFLYLSMGAALRVVSVYGCMTKARGYFYAPISP